MSEDHEHYDLGILVVHGVGTQESGETLVRFADRFYRWLQSWLDGTTEVWRRVGLGSDWRSRLRELDLSDPTNPGPSSPEGPGGPNGDDSDQLSALEKRVDAASKSREVSSDDFLAAIRSGEAPFFLSGQATIEATRLTSKTVAMSDGTARITTPQSTFELEALESSGRTVRERWLVAEAYWADAFTPPDVSEVTHWLIKVLPLTASTWVSRGIIETLRSSRQEDQGSSVGSHWLRRALQFLWALVEVIAWLFVGLLALPIVALVEVFLMLFLAVGWLPIPGIASSIRAIQNLITAVLGDPYSFAASPVREAAILHRFESHLQAIEPRCRELVVIGHSQGAAVSWLGLRNNPRQKVRLLVTVGSGLRNLHQLRLRMLPWMKAHFGEQAEGFWYKLAVLPLVYFGVGFLAWISGSQGWFLFLLALAGALYLTTGLVEAARDPIRIIDQLLEKFDSRFTWRDFYSTKDPIPNGPITQKTRPGFSQRRLTNYNSLLRDHTAYWENGDSFLSQLVHAIGVSTSTALPLHSMTPEDVHWIDSAGTRRAERVWLWQAYRWLTAVVALVAVTNLEQLTRLGELWDWTRNRLGYLTKTLLPAPGFEIPGAGIPESWAAGIVLVGLLFTFSTLFQKTWRSWNRNHVEEGFPRRTGLDSTSETVYRLVFSALFTATAALGAYILELPLDISSALVFSGVFFGLLFRLAGRS